MSGQRPEPDEISAGRQVALSVGDEFEVSAEDLPGAGFRWVAVDVPAGLTVVADDVAVAEPGGGSVGGPARRTFRVRGDAPGSYLLRLVLVRTWDPPDTAPKATTTVAVTVRPPD